jgi:hypothetical protein
MHVIKASLCYFALVFGTGFLLGSVRVLFLVPRLGVRVAELIEMPLMLVAVLLAARYVSKRFALAPSCRTRLGTGFLALALLIAAELLLTVAVQDQSLGQYIAGRDPVSGGVYLAMLLVFALMPLILGRADANRSRAHDRPAQK